MIIRLASQRPDSGVYTLRVIASHMFINPYVTLKNKLILFSFEASTMHHLMFCYEKRIQHAIWFKEKDILQLVIIFGLRFAFFTHISGKKRTVSKYVR